MTMNLDDIHIHRKNISLELGKLEREYIKSSTNHILHLILSLLTGGIWLIVWLIIANQNQNKRKRLEALIDDSRSAIIQIDSELIPKAQAEYSAGNEEKSVDCPWCAERILVKAKICKHCGNDVVNAEIN